MSTPQTNSEFTRIIDIRHIEDKPVTLTATPEECKALAKRFALVSVDSLVATVTLSRDGTAVLAKGRLLVDEAKGRVGLAGRGYVGEGQPDAGDYLNRESTERGAAEDVPPFGVRRH